MCGIAAVFGYSNPKLVLNLMLNALSHRGDQEDEIECFDNFGLGVRRLAIVDRSNGRQPIWNEDSTIAIIFNGEIYNHIELHKRLIKEGHIFRTCTDTEVILHAYEEYGLNALSVFDGMFSFVICNRVSGDFIAARDRFGIKPLHYSLSGDSVFLASEAKAMLTCTDSTIFEVGPGEYYTKLGRYPWYKLPKKKHIDSFSVSTLKINQLISNAVKKRLNTDLPIIVFLSGGIDSSIVLMLAKQFHPNIAAMTIGFAGSPDVKIATRLCRDLNIPLHILIISFEDILNNIEKTIYHSEYYTPNMIRGGVFSLILAQEAHHLGYKIALCGEGADEIFGGYGDFLCLTSSDSFLAATYSFIHDLYRTQLQRIDRLGMAYAVEIREPFMDISLVEYAINLPFEYKVGKLAAGKEITKFILREAFKQQLPNYVILRDKITLMKGTGLGHVDSSDNRLFQHMEQIVDESELEAIMGLYHGGEKLTREEAFYYRIYFRYYDGRIPKMTTPMTAKVEIE